MRSIPFIVFGLVAFLWTFTGEATVTRTARGTVHNINNSNQSTLSVTIGTTGSSLMFEAANSANATVTSATWTGGGCTFSAADITATDGTREVEIWSCHNVTAATATLTVNWSANSTNRDIIASEVNGSNGTMVFNSPGAGNSGSSKNGTTSNLTCAPNTSAGCFWYGVSRQSNTTTCAIPTQTGQTSTNTAECYEIDTTSVTQGASFNYNITGSWAVAMATYKEPAGASDKPSLGLTLGGFGAILFPSTWFLHPVWLP